VSFLLQSVWNLNDFDRKYSHANVHLLGEYEGQHWVIRWSFMVFQGQGIQTATRYIYMYINHAPLQPISHKYSKKYMIYGV